MDFITLIAVVAIAYIIYNYFKDNPPQRNAQPAADEYRLGKPNDGRVLPSTPRLAEESSVFEDASLLRVLTPAGEGGPRRQTKKSGLEHAILSAIAEGDENITAVYKTMTIGPTGMPMITKEMVKTIARRAEIDIKRVEKELLHAESVSICFLLDTTGSMESHIDGVKEQIVDIVRLIQHKIQCQLAGLAFVGYKDWHDGDDHFEMLQFTKDVADFKSFVGKIKATGGGDPPEDVIGGLDRAVSLSWPSESGSRILFHIGDAPPHGRGKYHDMDEDEYPSGHIRDRDLSDLFEEMKDKHINYHFGRMNNLCDKMIEIFQDELGSKIETVDSTIASSICSSVIRSVTQTVSATTSASISGARRRGLAVRTFDLVPQKPNTSRLPLRDAIIHKYELPDSIDRIVSYERFTSSTIDAKIKIADNPFAKGSVRLAYYGELKEGSAPNAQVIFKEMITVAKHPRLDANRYLTDLETQTVASKLALEFNQKLNKTPKKSHIQIKFLKAKVVHIKNSSRWLACENRFPDGALPMIKFNNNAGFVQDPETMDSDGKTRLELATAFSHFTYSITAGYLLVCDIQGIRAKDSTDVDTLLLTDPAIHCAQHPPRFGKTNLGQNGFNRFFKRHECNQYCRALKLSLPTELEE